MLTKTSFTIRLHPNDDVVIARQQLVSGTVLLDEKVTISGLIPPGHKVATRAIAVGEPVKRYNQIIGFAKRPIAPGEHVHLHNLAMGDFARDYAVGADATPTAYAATPATFMGIVRGDGPNKGRVATRNYIGILSTVNCSATVAHGIADAFKGEALAQFPNVDGVVALTHGSGCGMDVQGESMQVLRRTLGGYARHAEFRRGADRRPGLRGEPDQCTARRRTTHRRPFAAHLQHPGYGRHVEVDCEGCRDGSRDVAARQRCQA